MHYQKPEGHLLNQSKVVLYDLKKAKENDVLSRAGSDDPWKEK